MSKAGQRTNRDKLGQPLQQRPKSRLALEDAPDGVWRRVAELYKTPNASSEEATRKRLYRARKRGQYWFRRGQDNRPEVLCDRDEPDRPLPKGNPIVQVGKARPASKNPEIGELRALIAALLRMPRLEKLSKTKSKKPLQFPLSKANWHRLVYLLRQYPKEMEATIPEKDRIFFRPEEDGFTFSVAECALYPLNYLIPSALHHKSVRKREMPTK